MHWSVDDSRACARCSAYMWFIFLVNLPIFVDCRFLDPPWMPILGWWIPQVWSILRVKFTKSSFVDLVYTYVYIYMQIYVAFTKFIMFFLGEWIEWIPILFQMILSHRPIKSLEPRSSPAWRAWDVAPRQEPLAPRLKFLLFYIHMGLFENRIYHIIPNIWMYELNSVIFMGKWSLTIKVWGTLLSNKLMYIYIYTIIYIHIHT